jgi:hypothetical protein
MLLVDIQIRGIDSSRSSEAIPPAQRTCYVLLIQRASWQHPLRGSQHWPGSTVVHVNVLQRIVTPRADA